MPRVFERRGAGSEGERVWSVKTASAVRAGRSLGVVARRNQLQKSVGGIRLREAHAILSPERFVGGDGGLARHWTRKARAACDQRFAKGCRRLGCCGRHHVTAPGPTAIRAGARVSPSVEVTLGRKGNLIVTERLNRRSRPTPIRGVREHVS